MRSLIRGIMARLEARCILGFFRTTAITVDRSGSPRTCRRTLYVQRRSLATPCWRRISSVSGSHPSVALAKQRRTGPLSRPCSELRQSQLQPKAICTESGGLGAGVLGAQCSVVRRDWFVLWPITAGAAPREVLRWQSLGDGGSVRRRVSVTASTNLEATLVAAVNSLVVFFFSLFSTSPGTNMMMGRFTKRRGRFRTCPQGLELPVWLPYQLPCTHEPLSQAFRHLQRSLRSCLLFTRHPFGKL